MVVFLPGRDDPSRRNKRMDKVTRLLETRLEQLQAEKERLLYGEQRRGHPLDNGDGCSAIHRDPQASPSTKPYHPVVFSAPVVLAGPASPSPPYSPPTSPRGHPSSTTSTWSPAARGSCAVALPAASAPWAANGTSCGGSWQQQLAAEALVDMARTGGTPVAQRRTVQREQSFAPAVQQRSTVVIPAAPNQPVPRTHAAMPEIAQHLQYGSYIQHGVPPASPFGSVKMQPPPTAPPCCSVKLQPLPAASPYSTPLLQPFPRAYLAWTPLQRLPAAPARNAPTEVLRKKFETLVMCNFTPRRPSELQTSRWVSFNTLFFLFGPDAGVWLNGPGNLKQLITKWYKDHPAFAGLAVNKWCKRLTNNITQDGRGGYTFKFCFEHTPNEAAAI